jgi:hypothetical protein
MINRGHASLNPDGPTSHPSQLDRSTAQPGGIEFVPAEAVEVVTHRPAGSANAPSTPGTRMPEQATGVIRQKKLARRSNFMLSKTQRRHDIRGYISLAPVGGDSSRTPLPLPGLRACLLAIPIGIARLPPAPSPWLTGAGAKPVPPPQACRRLRPAPSRRPVAAPPSRPPRSLRGSIPQFPRPSRWERFIRWVSTSLAPRRALRKRPCSGPPLAPRAST